MDPNATVADMLRIKKELSRETQGAARRALLNDLAMCRRDLRDWKRRGGFEPNIGWSTALAL